MQSVCFSVNENGYLHLINIFTGTCPFQFRYVRKSHNTLKFVTKVLCFVVILVVYTVYIYT